MADRYSIDDPGFEEEEFLRRDGENRSQEGISDVEDDDLAVFSDEVAAEEALGGGANNKKSGSDRTNMFKSGRNKLASLLTKKTVSWGPSPNDSAASSGRNSDDSEASKDKPHRLANLGPPRGSHNNRTSSRYQRLNDSSRLSDSDSDLDSDVDIEIDLETHPTRRRARNTSFLRKMHLFLFLVFVLGGLVFYSNVLSPPSKSKSDPKPIKKPLMSNGTHDFYPTTLVISLDGMHPHYVSEDLTPNMHKMFTQNSAAPYMIPSFPSSTFPNHWTLVTGLYPANHGIVGNTFWDPKVQRQFVNVKPQLSLWPQWWGGKSLWDTARSSGVKSAVHMWPGSEVNWGKDRGPMHVDKFNQTEQLSAKSRRVFDWLDEPSIKDRPELIMTYVPNVDALGHKYGIYGSEIRDVLRQTDKLIGELLDGIKKRNLEDIVNFIVLSDHGMAPTNNSRLIFLEDIVEVGDFSHNDGSPLVGLRPKADLTTSVSDIYKSLKEKEPSDGSWSVYLDSNMPKEWHFGNMRSKYDSRIAPLWIVPSVGWAVTTRDKLKEMGGTYLPFGVHGYNNTETLMRALFLAKGPFFSKGYYAPFANVDVYNILCATLGITPASNDGSKSFLRPLPKNWHDDQPYPNVKFHTEVLKVNATYDLLFDDVHTEDVEKGENRNSAGEHNESAASSSLPSTLAVSSKWATASSSPSSISTSAGSKQSDATDRHNKGQGSNDGGDHGHDNDDDDDESLWEEIEGGAEDVYDSVKGWVTGLFGQHKHSDDKEDDDN